MEGGEACTSCNDSGCTDRCCGDSWCDLGDPWTFSDAVLSDWLDDADMDDAFSLGGWTQWGYHSESNGLLNNHDSQFGNHQSWIYLEKLADGSDSWDWGFRFDVMYGLDAQETQAFGEPLPQDHWDNPWDQGSYGWAIPQLYAELAYGNWKVIAGHFYTLIGHEVVPATGNFFYSHAYTWFNSEPFTHTGAVATYQASEDLEVYGGWTAGWDTGFDAFSDGDTSKGSNFLGGFNYAVTDTVALRYITTLGDLGVRGEGYSHTIMATVNITDKWLYILHSDLVSTNTRVANDQISIVNYLHYTYNDCLAFGTRAEWWKSDGVSHYEWTWGINYKPIANLLVRPELRHDWVPAGKQASINGKDNFTTFGVDAILTF